jgi:hypothetical protein
VIAQTKHARLQNSAYALAIAAGMLVPAASWAQASPSAPAPGAWRYAATIYGYLPTVGGSTSFPADSSGSPINITSEKILDSLKFMFMGALDAHNGRWGLFTDLVYFNLGQAKVASRDFTLGPGGVIPAGTTADLDLGLKGLAWTVAGQYRVTADPAWTVDLLGGARLLNASTDLRWSITGNLGPIAPTGRTGTAEASLSNWDAIVGVKGRYTFGANREWSLPFYLDAGTGQSDRTFQSAAGVSYAFQWGEITGMWRYLDYKMKPGQGIKEMNFNGPMIGATWRW